MLALGKAATSTITVSAKGSIATPMRMAMAATRNTSTGCTSNLMKAMGK